ncbi:MAG: DUF1997 domain-containing protein [Cyanobacteria bacterium J06632_22]
MVCFSASQSVRLSVPSLQVPIQDYLADPERLVYALVDPARVEMLTADTFRLNLRPFSFLMLTLEPVSDMQVYWSDSAVHIDSDTCWLKGQPALNQHFSFALRGILSPLTEGDKTYLTGQANLQVTLDLPMSFRLTPKALIQKTGSGILNGILKTMKQRLLNRLVDDYRTWATQLATVSALRR